MTIAFVINLVRPSSPSTDLSMSSLCSCRRVICDAAENMFLTDFQLMQGCQHRGVSLGFFFKEHMEARKKKSDVRYSLVEFGSRQIQYCFVDIFFM